MTGETEQHAGDDGTPDASPPKLARRIYLLTFTACVLSVVMLKYSCPQTLSDPSEAHYFHANLTPDRRKSVDRSDGTNIQRA